MKSHVALHVKASAQKGAKLRVISNHRKLICINFFVGLSQFILSTPFTKPNFCFHSRLALDHG